MFRITFSKLSSLTFPLSRTILLENLNSLPGIIRIHLRADVAVADVRFVDDLELLDGLLFFAHAFQHAAEVVNQVLLFLVKAGLFLDGVLQRARREVEHFPFRKTLREITHRGEPFVRILLRLLKLLSL